MTDMRRKGTGTFDHATATWKLKGKNINQSTRQLGKLFGEDIPKSKIKSRPYWEQYLSALAATETATKKAKSPLQLRIWSIERLIAMQRERGLDCELLESELLRCINIPAHNIDDANEVMFSPDITSLASDLGMLNADTLSLAILEQKLILPVVKVTVHHHDSKSGAGFPWR